MFPAWELNALGEAVESPARVQSQVQKIRLSGGQILAWHSKFWGSAFQF
jgi:hypothetical protein